MSTKFFLGIDPGQTGAAILLDGEAEIACCLDWPGDPVEAARRLTGLFPVNASVTAAIERVHAMPKQGVASTFKFGMNYGAWLGILAALCIPTLNPTPQEWQKGQVRPTDGKDAKARSLAAVRRFWPTSNLFNRQKDHGRADAALLAFYAYSRLRGNN